ncbi:reverse transcriptase domain-containing protein [Orientia tsutsugamushi]|uniref:reverse transcriptase domain-containing protein n=1 Tax=Orientia tsutsugamushi TaxID=784 RepID=UPI0025B04F64|nr:reverse transcriptase domain-containing protein [Orientia tsutsugamushi]
MRQHGYNPSPLRRIYIPKSNGQHRLLDIPTMRDRSMQALYKLALGPISKTTADRHSYGFRHERSTADAIKQCYIVLARKSAPEWILKADIRGCFNNINHEWLLNNIPMNKTILQKFLKTKYLKTGKTYSIESGTPQDGIISPLLANMALDGLGELLTEKLPMKISSRKPALKVNYIVIYNEF